MSSRRSTLPVRATTALVLLVIAGCGPGLVVHSLVSLPPPRGDDEPTATEPVTPLQNDTEVTRETVGAFVILEEKYRWPEGRPLIPHVPSRWTKIHLSFDTPDRRVNVSLTDTGANLSARAESSGCYVLVSYLQYGRGGDERHLYAAMDLSLRELVKVCRGRVEGADEYRRLLREARADFPEAIRAMKARVSGAFGVRTERCRAPNHSDVFDACNWN